MATKTHKNISKNQNQPETKTILEVRSTCSGKKKQKCRSNYIYKMKLNNTKMTPILAHWHAPCKIQNMINLKKCRFPNVFLKQNKNILFMNLKLVVY